MRCRTTISFFRITCSFSRAPAALDGDATAAGEAVRAGRRWPSCPHHPPTRAGQQPLPSPSAAARPSRASSTNSTAPSLHACKQQWWRSALLPCVRAAADTVCKLRPKGRKQQGRRASPWCRAPASPHACRLTKCALPFSDLGKGMDMERRWRWQVGPSSQSDNRYSRPGSFSSRSAKQLQGLI
jgi:hypothetical protein